jgi:hypothetical protein
MAQKKEIFTRIFGKYDRLAYVCVIMLLEIEQQLIDEPTLHLIVIAIAHILTFIFGRKTASRE